jgi:glutamate-1-semialdehyde 2,1-aminomutase
MILGHAHPLVIKKIQETAELGLSFGAPTQLETDLAEKICSLMPSIEMIRMVNSGTEATMSAIRLARGFTGRDKIVKFEGCYHGHADSLLVKAGSGALTLGQPDSAGVPKSFAENTLTLEFNNLTQVQELFDRVGEEIAAIIVEPVAGNMGCIPPVEGFLECLRDVCTQHDSLLIFDEVMTGFRVALGGAQTIYNVKPDLTTLGKVIGGGMPVGAFGGRKDVMSKLAPLGDVYQAGTLSGNPIAMTAGLTTLSIIEEDSFFTDLTAATAQLVNQLQTLANQAGVPFSTNQVGGMFGFFFTPVSPVTNFDQVMNADGNLFSKFFVAMLAQGINFAPSPFEAAFVSSAHGEVEFKRTLDAAEQAFHTLT